MRTAPVAALSALILFGSIPSLSQEAHVVTTDHPLTVEEEWSNAMLYADRLVLEGIGGTAGGAAILGLCGWSIIKGFNMLISLEEPGMLRAGAGLVLIFGGTLWARAGMLWVLLAATQWSIRVKQRDELLAFGQNHGWERQDEIIYPEDPDAAMRVDPTRGDPGQWLEWFREISPESP